jgi:fructosamine-3-kinase
VSPGSSRPHSDVGTVDEVGTGRLEELVGARVSEVRALGGQHGVRHLRLGLADGRVAFAKVADRASAAGPARSAGSVGSEGFAAEAASLRWLSAAAAAPVPAVLAAADDVLVIEWVDAGSASREAASRFGVELARLHAAGAAHFGAPWAGVIAGLPLPNNESDEWPSWFAAQRILPYTRLALDAGTLTGADVRMIESVADRIGDLAGPPEPPARIHGDCWSGNVLWSGGRGWLIDPAAHGGHRESDLAMLSLFGAPHLDGIVASYQDVAPLAAGWQDRVPLHQLHPLLVHVCLFGAAYTDAAVGAARAALRA